MFKGSGRFRERIVSIAQKFREKGATSPDKAMSSQELGLPPRFDEAMKRRLGNSGIFIDVGGGRYYLNETRLNDFQNRPQGTGMRPSMYRRRANMIAFRIVRSLLGVFIVALALFNFIYERSMLLWLAIIGLLILWILVTALQFRLQVGYRRRMMRHPSGNNPQSQ
jgi:hypothetical protein